MKKVKIIKVKIMEDYPLVKPHTKKGMVNATVLRKREQKNKLLRDLKLWRINVGPEYFRNKCEDFYAIATKMEYAEDIGVNYLTRKFGAIDFYVEISVARTDKKLIKRLLDSKSDYRGKMVIYWVPWS